MEFFYGAAFHKMIFNEQQREWEKIEVKFWEETQ